MGTVATTEPANVSRQSTLWSIRPAHKKPAAW